MDSLFGEMGSPLVAIADTRLWNTSVSFAICVYICAFFCFVSMLPFPMGQCKINFGLCTVMCLPVASLQWPISLSAHRTLRFTWSISNERIEFLDLNIFKGKRFNTNRHLDISTHFKKTNTFQYLHFSSSHPRSVFKGLVKGEAIRFLRSNTDPHTYNKTINKFREHLFLGTTPNSL